MKSRLSLSVFFCLVIILWSPVLGRIPGPLPCAEFSPVIVITPDGSIPYTISLKTPDCSAPIVGSFVEVAFAPDVDALIAWAPGQTHPTVAGFTDANGEITFYFAGSGCIDPTRFSGITYSAQVRYDGVVLDELYVVNSPDAVNSAGLLPPDLGSSICEDGVTKAGLADAVFHTAAIKLGLVEPCSRFTGDPTEPVTLDDAILLTPFIKNGVSGVCQ